MVKIGVICGNTGFDKQDCHHTGATLTINVASFRTFSSPRSLPCQKAAEAEYEIFQCFGELIGDRIAVLISHRFSTVRMADRIVVLSEGRIIELGSQKELISLDGAYARLFNLQA
jgi:hypothetical protein